MMVWKLIILLLTIMLLVYYPVQVGFEEFVYPNEFDFHKLVIWAIIITLCIDVVVTLLTAQYEEGELVLSQTKIKKKIF